MQAASTSEMAVNFYQTIRHNISEDHQLYIRFRENLKYHLVCFSSHYSFFLHKLGRKTLKQETVRLKSDKRTS